jgi:hypothetical protein
VLTQSDPVNEDEYVLRRIPNQHHIITRGIRRAVQRGAVVPGPKDVDGISVFREKFTSGREIAAAGHSSNGYYVVRIGVKEILVLGLTLQPDPQGNQPEGHALIPEINYSEYSAGGNLKIKSKQYQDKLTKLINEDLDGRIVHTPDGD